MAYRGEVEAGGELAAAAKGAGVGQCRTSPWPAGVVVAGPTMPGNSVIGMLAQNVCSVAGDSDASNVNNFLFQYFVNYNLEIDWH